MFTNQIDLLITFIKFSETDSVCVAVALLTGSGPSQWCYKVARMQTR